MTYVVDVEMGNGETVRAAQCVYEDDAKAVADRRAEQGYTAVVWFFGSEVYRVEPKPNSIR